MTEKSGEEIIENQTKKEEKTENEKQSEPKILKFTFNKIDFEILIDLPVSYCFSPEDIEENGFGCHNLIFDWMLIKPKPKKHFYQFFHFKLKDFMELPSGFYDKIKPCIDFIKKTVGKYYCNKSKKYIS